MDASLTSTPLLATLAGVVGYLIRHFLIKTSPVPTPGPNPLPIPLPNPQPVPSPDPSRPVIDSFVQLIQLLLPLLQQIGPLLLQSVVSNAVAQAKVEQKTQS